MNWKRKFKDFVLERGQSYYKRNRVRNLSCHDGVYRAQVVGSLPYNVEIKIQDDNPIEMKCSCPYAVSGQKCKHMAAVMFAIEEKQGGLEQRRLSFVPEEKKVHPFTMSTKSYQYFDMGRIAKELEFPEKTVAEARQLVRTKKIVLDEVNIGHAAFGSEGAQRGEAFGHCEGERYPWELKIIFDRDRIVQASCDVPRCGGRYEGSYYYSKKNMCKHLLALMFLLDEHLKKYNPGDSTNKAASALFDGYRDRHMRQVMEQQADQRRDFMLEPVLEREREGLYISFKAGTDRLYVVKKLTEFVNLYESQDIITFGTKTEIDLAKHRFNESSQAIYDYVRRIVKDEQERARSVSWPRGVYEDGEIKNRIPLYGERLDKFYELCEGKTVACTDKSSINTNKITLQLREEKPDIQLEVAADVDEERVVHGVRVTGKLPEMIQGSRHRYYFTKDSFCRMTGEMESELDPLLEISENGQVSFCVGRKHLSEFYHQVLPVLKRCAAVREIEAEMMQEYIPPEAVFAFYLDAENGVITCKPKAHYGENTVSLLDCLRHDSVLEEFRSQNQEEEILYYVGQLFTEVDFQRDEVYSEESEEAVLNLLDGGVDRLMALGEVHTTDRFRNMNVRKKIKVKVGVSVESEIMNLSISSEDIDQEELLDILKSYQRKKKYYRLKNGNFAEVNEADIEMLAQMMETMHLSPKDFVKGNMKIPVYRALYLNKMLEQSEEIYLNRDGRFKKLIKEFKTVEDSDFEVPSSLSDVMRNYQIRGFKWLKTLESYGFGGILADDMGLGKTLQMISVLVSAKEEAEHAKSSKSKAAAVTALIVCPASLVYNWNQEFARFAPELKVTMVVGNQQERAEIIHNYQDSDVLVTSYDLLKRDIAEYEDAEFAYQVLDEAQYIKNHSTAAAKAVKIIKSKHRYALTGTPIENRLSELWSIFDYLMPGFLYGYETFRKELETPIVKRQDDTASERLKKMVSPFILRRLKGDVLKDLPDKIEEIRYAKLETEQQHLYDGQVLHMQNVIASQDDGDFQKNKLQILAELTRIRQICCDPGLLFESYKGTSAKRTACMELIQSAIEGEHKILVFSQFTSMLELLEKDLNQSGIAYYKITGDTPKENRVEMVSAFNQDSTPVFLISLKAGGTGLNLTGADVVIHYDPWWNQAAQNQATDRAHRIGQTKAVSVYKLIAKDTIEEKIVKMQETKKNLADTILSGENGGITQMSREELMELLS